MIAYLDPDSVRSDEAKWYEEVNNTCVERIILAHPKAYIRGSRGN